MIWKKKRVTRIYVVYTCDMGDKNGTGCVFHTWYRYPLSKDDVLRLADDIKNTYGYKNVIITNIIPLID